jgi:hypothetical protein
VALKNDHSKLVSLLALAAGATAMPQTGNADIIYVDQNYAVSWDGLRSFETSNLPGNVQLGFAAHRSGSFSFTSSRWVTGGKRGSGYLQFKFYLLPAGYVWDQIPGGTGTAATFASATSSHFNGPNFSGVYMAFRFKDSTLPGTPMRYGWAGLSLQNGNLNTGNDFPKLTINGWAYDDTGAQIANGATAPVPEPSSTALLALGALALGAKGLRSWRRNRDAASQS